MLTQEERQLVVEAMEKYPAGVPANAWGSGPMSVPQGEDKEYPDPADFSRECCREYG